LYVYRLSNGQADSDKRPVPAAGSDLLFFEAHNLRPHTVLYFSLQIINETRGKQMGKEQRLERFSVSRALVSPRPPKNMAPRFI
jgi:hypothetical protein